MELPLFPLHLVLFPGRPLPLHIFEQRYRTMLDDCMKDDRRFGVVAIKAGQAEGGCAEIFEVGTIAQIESVTPLPDGRSDVITRGTRRFRVDGLVPGTPYMKGAVELLDEQCSDPDDHVHAAQLRELLVPYLAGLGAPEELLARLPSEPNELAYLAAAALQTEVPEQQRLLELDSTSTLLAATLQTLRREVCLMRHFGTVGSLRPPDPNGAQLN
ncbi:MAG: LON peptidase substrate-binding domain-containing protein [Egibacteraceae bacterium]